MRKLPIGTSDFKKVIEENFYYVDKTLFIQELIEANGEVILIPRPRRFGKSLNLSMLQYYFEFSNFDNSYLFKDTKIWEYKDFSKKQGKYPVISVTFKDAKKSNWQVAYHRFTEIISEEFIRHQKHIFNGLSEAHQNKYLDIVNKTANMADFGSSLKLLSELLESHYGKKVMVLIDEYDTPIAAAYNQGYYEEMVTFVRSLLTALLKDNKALERGILTGIFRTAKEGILSGLNNLGIYTLTDTVFQDKFGFVEHEVKGLLEDQQLDQHFSEIQRWYNGYQFGSAIIYNPWSVLSCANFRGIIKPYWANTSDNQLIKNIMIQSDEEVKSDFELLLSGKSVTKKIDEGIILPGIEKNPLAIWNLLLFAGYLTYKELKITEGKVFCDLIIPNKEINIIYRQFVEEIFTQTLTVKNVKLLLKSLSDADALSFEELLQKFIGDSMSVYDFSVNEPEKSYHLFILGLLVLFSDEYEVKSNRESGLGRYDIILIPKIAGKYAIIIEFKKVSEVRNETLETAAQNALKQIEDKKYKQELLQRGFSKIKTFGVAFEGKKIKVLAR